MPYVISSHWLIDSALAWCLNVSSRLGLGFRLGPNALQDCLERHLVKLVVCFLLPFCAMLTSSAAADTSDSAEVRNSPALFCRETSNRFPKDWPTPTTTQLHHHNQKICHWLQKIQHHTCISLSPAKLRTHVRVVSGSQLPPLNSSMVLHEGESSN